MDNKKRSKYEPRPDNDSVIGGGEYHNLDSGAEFVIPPEAAEAMQVYHEADTELDDTIRTSERWKQALLDSTASPDEVETEQIEFFLPSPEMPKGNSPEAIKAREYIVWAKSLPPLVGDMLTERFYYESSTVPHFALRSRNESPVQYIPGGREPELENPVAYVSGDVQPAEEAATVKVARSAADNVFQGRIEASQARAAEYAVAEQQRKAVEQRIQEAQKASAEIVELRRKRTEDAIESAYRMAEEETRKRMEQLQLDIPRGGLSWRAQLAMVGVAATALLFSGLRLANEFEQTDTNRDEIALAYKAPGIGETTIAQESQPTIQESVLPTETTPAPAAASAAVIETAPLAQTRRAEVGNAQIRSEMQVPPEAVSTPPTEVKTEIEQGREYLETMRSLNARPDFLPEQAPVRQDAQLVVEMPTVEPDNALATLEDNLGKQRRVQVGPITIKRGLFGALKIHHDDIPGWLPLDESLASSLTKNYQLDVASGQAKSTLYGMTAEQFMDAVPDDTKAKKRWEKKQRG